jgi:hypothetical protein
MGVFLKGAAEAIAYIPADAAPIEAEPLLTTV